MTATTAENSSRMVKTKKWNLHINEAGTGYPVILLHGTGPGATGWSNFSTTVLGLENRYRVIALDFPGWGKSDPLDPSKEARDLANAEAVALLMDELGLKKAAIVGNSMGGAAATHLISLHPERVSHLITMGSGIFGMPNFHTPGGLTEGIRIIRETYADPSPENFRRLVSIMVFDQSFVTDDLCKMRSVAALSNRTHLDNWIKGFGPAGKAGISPGELLAKVSSYKGPCLFVHGRDDRVVPIEGTLRLVAAAARSQAHIYNQCGHWAQIEHAKAFNELVDSFLQTSGLS